MLAEISHYRVEEQIGKGGMGVVFRAMDTRLNRQVALKFLSEESLKHDGARYRLLREARAASALNHGNIAMIHEIDDSDDHTFIAMEYVEGETIRDRLEKGPLPTPEALNYAAQIADALSEAHSKRIVHRDIKSSNVVIKPNGQVKVLDFGLAKFQAPDENTNENEASTVSTLTQSGTVIGTVAYMSPEQLRSQELDGRSDIFSLGVVLYEMVSGHKPFERANKIDSFGATLHEVPTPITEYVSDVPPSVIKLIDKCLEKNPNNRYQSSANLHKDLVKLKDEIETGSMSLTDRLMRAIRTRGAWRALTAAVIVVVIASVSLAVYTIVEGGLPFSSSAKLNGINRIAVMPIRVLNKKSDDSELIADSMTDSLLTSLAKTKRFSVLTARSTEQYRDSKKDEQEIGRELQVDGLVETSMLEKSGHLKLTMSLVRCKDKTTVWSDEVETFDNSVFSAQDRTSTLVGRLVGMPEDKAAKDLNGHASMNQQALRSYEKGKLSYNRMTEEGLQEAIRLYDEALKADPNFTLAYAELSNAYAQYVNLLEITDPKWLDLADENAAKALALDPGFPEAHFAQGRAHMLRYMELGTGDPEQAKREVLESLELDKEFAPSLHWLVAVTADEYYLSGDKSKLAQTIDYYNRANQLDPNYQGTEKNIGLVYAFEGNYDEAISHMERLKTSAPQYLDVYENLAYVYSLKREYDHSIEQMRKVLERKPADPVANAMMAAYLVSNGQREEASKILDQMAGNPTGQFYVELCLASAYAGLDRKDEALRHLELYAKLTENKKHYIGILSKQMVNDPNFQSVRSEPEYLSILHNQAGSTP